MEYIFSDEAENFTTLMIASFKNLPTALSKPQQYALFSLLHKPACMALYKQIGKQSIIHWLLWKADEPMW